MSEPDGPHWYLVQARPRQAARAVANLQQQGYRVFHPQIRVEQLRRGRPALVEQSLFPDYLFIRLQPGVDNYGPVRSTRGVLQLVGFGTAPVPFNAAFVEMLQARLDAQYAAVSTPDHDSAHAAPETPNQALDDILSLAEPHERIRALMELLHRQMRVARPSATRPVAT